MGDKGKNESGFQVREFVTSDEQFVVPSILRYILNGGLRMLDKGRNVIPIPGRVTLLYFTYLDFDTRKPKHVKDRLKSSVKPKRCDFL